MKIKMNAASARTKAFRSRSETISKRIELKASEGWLECQLFKLDSTEVKALEAKGFSVVDCDGGSQVSWKTKEEVTDDPT